MLKPIDGAEDAGGIGPMPDRPGPRNLSLAARDGMRVGQQGGEPTEQRQPGDAGIARETQPDASATATESTVRSRDNPGGTRQRGNRDTLWIDRFLEKTEKTAMLERAARAERAATAAPVRPVESAAAAHAAPRVEQPGGSQPLPASPEADSVSTLAMQLATLPDELNAQLDRLASVAEIADESIQACWQALEHNTKYLSASWDYILPIHPPADPRYEADPDVSGADVVLPRFWDILPVRKTAVPDPVRTNRNALASVLNANHMSLPATGKLIASQKPVAGEVPGFQQMLVDEKVALVVDLTRYDEREPRALYAPELQGLSLSSRGGGLIITCEARRDLPDAGTIEQSLSIDDGAALHGLKRLHFPHWPDHGAIEIDSLIALADRVEALAYDPERALVIHCRAGVGRTGTLMSFMSARGVLHALQRQAGCRHTPESILRTALAAVARGRACRGPGFVQVEAQFTLLVQALARTFLQPVRVVGAALDAPPLTDCPNAAQSDRPAYSLVQRLHGRLLYLRQKWRRMVRPPRP